MLKRIAYIVLCILLVQHVSYAQVPKDAAEQFNKAMRLRNKKDDSLAYLTMKDAIRKYSGYANAYSTLGEWYFTDRKFSDAVETFNNAARNCRDGQTAFALPLARSLLYDLRPTEALQYISPNRNSTANAEWQTLYKQALFMQGALQHQLKDTVFNIGMRINTPYPEMFPAISADTQTLYFTRKVRNVDMDFYKSTEDSCGGWFTGRNLGSPTNTPNHEAAQMISADGHYLFFMRCDNRSENGWDQGGCDLYMSYTADSVWSIAQSFGATINTPAYEGMPCLSPDNRDLYFVSDKKGGYGGLDIWVSRFENGYWQKPRNLGAHINTAGDETAPFLHIDNQTLFFASTGLTGMGGADIFYSRRMDDTTWGRPKNMGYPVNTPANENSISITIDGERAYLASDRDSVEGNYDIYETALAEELRPVKVAVLKGYTYDSLTKENLNNTRINIYDAESGSFLYRFVTNRGDGSFMITLPVGKKYAYNADRMSYKEMIDTIDLKGIDSGLATVIPYSIPLLPGSYRAPVHDSLVATVYFAKNSATLSEEANNAIYEAILPWLDDLSFNVIINSYTDNTGTPMINEELSAIRAGVVAKALEAYGISEYNITSYGWGEVNPVASNDTELGRDLNRRAEIVIRR